MPKGVSRARPARVYSNPATLANLDQRTREARLMRETRAELIAHVGGSPSTPQRAMIDQAVQLRLRLAVMDRRFADTRAQTDHDSRVYLAWANSLTRLLNKLGLESPPPHAPTLQEYLAGRSAGA